MIFFFISSFAWTGAWAGPSKSGPEFLPCSPETDFTIDQYRYPGDDPKPLDVASLGFCSEWNPEFGYNGGHCCRKFKPATRHHASGCANHRRRQSYCDERTPEQIDYGRNAGSGKLGDLLYLVSSEIGRRNQAYCTVNTGFLAFGRELVPTPTNRIALRDPNRCSNFGTDPMIAMLEWLGREVAHEYSEPEYSGVKLVVGDVAAPRGGCLGHASHTTGQDVDIGFLTVKAGHDSPVDLVRTLDGKTEWWLVKKIIKNPYACVKVIFLDKKLIRKLEKAAVNDPDWKLYWRFIRHMKNHKNHTHVRIGDGPGEPGCKPNAHPELENLDDNEGAPGEGDEQDAGAPAM